MDRGELLLSCSEARWLLFTKLVFSISLAILTIILFEANLVVVLFLLYILFFSFWRRPDLVLYEKGILVDRVLGKSFIMWDEINKVRMGAYRSRLYVKTFPWSMRILLYDSYIFFVWWKNYKEAQKIIKSKIMVSTES